MFCEFARQICGQQLVCAVLHHHHQLPNQCFGHIYNVVILMCTCIYNDTYVRLSSVHTDFLCVTIYMLTYVCM